MKIILSRKGFDSANGGQASPIFPNGDMLSLPIPDEYDNIGYSDLKHEKYKSYYNLIKILGSNYIKKKNKRKLITENTKCHLDPDLIKSVLERKEGWKPTFGQSKQAQSHLENQGIKEGDLFLFFGWFRKTIFKNNKLIYDPKDREGRHIIFGYLQIGEILKINKESKIPKWLEYHPHINNMERRKSKNNTIYIARNNLTWNRTISGGGHFTFDESLVLTKEGYSRSKWDLPEIFKKGEISYHSNKSWKTGYFQSAGRGQEFVIQDNIDIENWAKGLIQKNIRKN